MFRVTLQNAATFVFALATLAACDAEPSAPQIESPMRASVLTTASGNIISRESATVPFSLGVFAPCANGGQGEVLDFNGQLEYTAHFITTTQGERQHNFGTATFSGSGYGWDTGETYDVVTRELLQVNSDYGNDGILDSTEELQRIWFGITNRATGASFDIILVGRFVQTATGEFVLDSWDGTARCN